MRVSNRKIRRLSVESIFQTHIDRVAKLISELFHLALDGLVQNLLWCERMFCLLITEKQRQRMLKDGYDINLRIQQLSSPYSMVLSSVAVRINAASPARAERATNESYRLIRSDAHPTTTGEREPIAIRIE